MELESLLPYSYQPANSKALHNIM